MFKRESPFDLLKTAKNTRPKSIHAFQNEQISKQIVKKQYPNRVKEYIDGISDEEKLHVLLRKEIKVEQKEESVPRKLTQKR